MKGIIYLVSVVIVTGIVLTFLFYYEKGQTKDLTNIGNLDLGSGVQLSLEKVLAKPAASTRFYLIFYIKSKNTTSAVANLQMQYPVDPCSKYSHSTTYTPGTYRYGQTPQPLTTATPVNTFLQCQQSQEYKTYLQNKDEYEKRKVSNVIEVQTEDGQICTINNTYKINNSRPNLGSLLFSSYKATETKAGTMVYDCPTNKGKFSIKYLTQSLNFEL